MKAGWTKARGELQGAVRNDTGQLVYNVQVSADFLVSPTNTPAAAFGAALDILPPSTLH